jgi:hypothetical protein
MAFGVSLFALFMLGSQAFAVHDAGLVEMDGNIVNDVAGPPLDWNGIFTADGSGNGIPGTLPAGTVDSVFVRDFVPGAAGPDPSYYTPSTKDDQSINPADAGEVWKCRKVANPTDKDEILNAYAFVAPALSGPDAGDLMFMVGGERFDNNGSAFIGVWLFQGDVGCVAPGRADVFFSGAKTDGDILVLVNFTNGGAITSLDAFLWHPCDAPGTPIPPNKCTDPATNPGFFTLAPGGGAATECPASTATTPGDNLCAKVLVGTVTPPWLTQDKQPDATGPLTLDTSEFFEAGLNLTDLLGTQVGGEGVQGTEPCISTFLMETRSSSTLSATLKDFALGNFDTCGSKSGVKFEDTDGDGVKDAGEPGLNGWPITMFRDTSGDGLFTAADFPQPTGFPKTTSTATVGSTAGSYGFTDLQPGTYFVCEAAQPGGALGTGWSESLPNAGTTDQVSCAAAPAGTAAFGYKYVNPLPSGTINDDTNNDFGNFRQGTKSGVKFEDLNANGTKDGGEPGLNGWTIRAFKDTNGDGVLDPDGVDNILGNADDETLVASATTATVSGVDGSYSFSLNPGTYIVCERIDNQPGFTQSRPSNTKCSAGTGLAPGGYAVTITSGSSEANNDFGNFAPREGCTPGFWQGGLGSTLWNSVNDPDWTAHGGAGTNPFIHTTLFNSFFTAYTGDQGSLAGLSMFDLVSTGGGPQPAVKAARMVVAAYLNASFGISYPFTTTQISQMWTDAVNAGTSDAFLNVFNTLGAANNLGCPIS